MHSRIYQISKNPIDKCDYIEESHYYDHWFIGSVADYVSEYTDRNDDIQWLKDCYEKRGISFGIDNNGEYFVIEDKTQYFAPKFEVFQKTLSELLTLTFDDFVSGKSGYPLYSLKNAFNEKFGFYVDGEDINMESFDSFVRYADIDVKYYIGATIDYHC